MKTIVSWSFVVVVVFSYFREGTNLLGLYGSTLAGSSHPYDFEYFTDKESGGQAC